MSELSKSESEVELFKALMGLKFRCSICGRQHDPEKIGWINCMKKMIHVFRKYRIIQPSVPFKYYFKKGSDVEKRVKLYSTYLIPLWNNPFELVTIADKIEERNRRFEEWEKATQKCLISDLKKMPDVETLQAYPYDSENIIIFDTVKKSTVRYPISVLRSMFRPPVGDWSDRQFNGNEIKYHTYRFVSFTPDLKYAVVQRIVTYTKKRQLMDYDTEYYLLRNDGEYVKIKIHEKGYGIKVLREKYNL